MKRERGVDHVVAPDRGERGEAGAGRHRYQQPLLDRAIDEELQDYVERRKAGAAPD